MVVDGRDGAAIAGRRGGATDGDGGCGISSSIKNGRTASGATTDNNTSCSEQREIFNVPATLRARVLTFNTILFFWLQGQGPRFRRAALRQPGPPAAGAAVATARSSQSRSSQSRGRRSSSTGHSSSSRGTGRSSGKTRGRMSCQQSRQTPPPPVPPAPGHEN